SSSSSLERLDLRRQLDPVRQLRRPDRQQQLGVVDEAILGIAARDLPALSQDDRHADSASFHETPPGPLYAVDWDTGEQERDDLISGPPTERQIAHGYRF